MKATTSSTWSALQDRLALEARQHPVEPFGAIERRHHRIGVGPCRIDDAQADLAFGHAAREAIERGSGIAVERLLAQGRNLVAGKAIPKLPANHRLLPFIGIAGLAGQRGSDGVILDLELDQRRRRRLSLVRLRLLRRDSRRGQGHRQHRKSQCGHLLHTFSRGGRPNWPAPLSYCDYWGLRAIFCKLTMRFRPRNRPVAQAAHACSGETVSPRRHFG